MSEIRQRIACKAIIQHEGKVLILREADAQAYEEGTNAGRYHLPGGRLNPGEPFLKGLAREVFEETGLEVSVDSPAPVFVGEWFPVIKGEQNHIVGMFFGCTALTNNVQLSAEHDDYRWIDPALHAAYNLVPPEPEVFDAFLRSTAGKT